ncbi:2',3'-cyclic-nucleotide 3'-phosphodiesterase [Ictalurus punctatus]|uniref:2',3'-cyclic-nucleotide 3'-phosphodiesterase n=1 Tax=Ictalurus punctatus TaxID=7998 RepID=W5ULG8_ICTPU|nr:2',3'-cyclic-nucleotide 3'-phosphodiesterase [Ictalurus punctatus]XP_017309124.1 2',3'-cyclic-nucleotide 3'-phosphodiesterase [Ictalurus punctatus]XP_017309132.1 2',3'-cyclic-nucleotide 3'-phosphodiesterase [Ictalurus punctatus]
MEADQNQEAPEAVAQTYVAETDVPTPEEVNETYSAQDPPEPEKPAVEDSKPEMESTEQAPEVESAKENASSEAAAVLEKLPEKEEVAEEISEKAVEVEKSAETPTEVEKKPEIEVVEQQIAEPAEPEKKAEPEKDGKTEPSAANEAATSELENESEKAEAKPTEAEQEEPAEAQVVQDEPPKEVVAQPKEPALPMFYGWFLLSEVEEKIKCSTMEFLKTLDTLEAFKKQISEFTGDADKEVDLEQYFQTKIPLHCTTQFCDYGKAEGAKEYAELQVVKNSIDTQTELSVVGLIVTPRTFGARVSLTPEQLSLWPTGADKVGIPQADLAGVETLPVGSRAHVTLGCAAGVEAVQTGIDLLEILILQQGEEKAATEEELELGTLSYLGKGRWYLALREAVTCDATFSSFSEELRPTEPAKKEGGEKKKKPKCSIL